MEAANWLMSWDSLRVRLGIPQVSAYSGRYRQACGNRKDPTTELGDAGVDAEIGHVVRAGEARRRSCGRGQLMMAPNRVKLEMLGQRIGQRRDATRALTQVPTGWGSFGCPTSHTVGQKAVNPRGMGTASPYQITSLPDSKKELKKDVDKGWGVPVPLPSQRYQHHAECQQADEGVGRGPGGPPHHCCRVPRHECRRRIRALNSMHTCRAGSTSPIYSLCSA